MMRYMLLGLLRHDGMGHGYALTKKIRLRTGLQISIGSVYRELGRLSREGMVRSAPNPPGADSRRAPYEITAAGISAFEAWLSTGPRKSLGLYHDEFSAFAFFLGQAEPSLGRRIIERWREEVDMHGKTLHRAREAAITPGSHGGSPLALLPFFLGRGLKHLAVDREFVEELRAAHEGWAETGRAAPAVVPRPRLAAETIRPRPRRARTAG